MGDNGSTRSFPGEVERCVRARLVSEDREPMSPARSWTVRNVTCEQRENDNWDLVVFFSDSRHPECAFGFRFGDLRKWQELVPEPEPLANICVANFEEAVEAGDSGFGDLDCRPGETVWV